MQSVSSRIWTRIAVSIPYDDNHYTTGTSKHAFTGMTISKGGILFILVDIINEDIWTDTFHCAVD